MCYLFRNLQTQFVIPFSQLYSQKFRLISIIFMTMQQQTHKNKKIVKEQKVEKEIKQEPMEHLPLIADLMAIPQQDREDRCSEYMEKVKPFLFKYAQKKLGSRVLQLIFKWGNQKVKEQTHKIIKQHWKDLIKSKYALYLIEHVVRVFPMSEVVNDAILLQSSWEGAKIVHTYLQSSGEQGSRLLKGKFYELWQKSKKNDLKAQEKLHNLTLKIIEKQYDSYTLSKLVLRLSLGSMFAEEKQKVLEYLAEKVAEWVGDEEGVRLFFEVINHSDPKLKKTLVRAFKSHVKEIVQLNNPTYVALIKLLTEVDDTVFILKSFQTEIQQLFSLMNTNRHAFSIIFALFSPRTHNYNILGKYEHDVSYTECKKSEEVRKKEIRKGLYQPLLAFLDDNQLPILLRNHINNKLVIGIYKSLEEDNQKELFDSFITKVSSLYLQDAKTSIKSSTFSESLAADPNANKILKQILILADEVVDYFCDQFAKLATANLRSFLETKASFVLLGLIQKGGRDFLLQQVRRNRKQLEGAVAGQHYINLLQKK